MQLADWINKGLQAASFLMVTTDLFGNTPLNKIDRWAGTQTGVGPHRLVITILRLLAVPLVAIWGYAAFLVLFDGLRFVWFSALSAIGLHDFLDAYRQQHSIIPISIFTSAPGGLPHFFVVIMRIGSVIYTLFGIALNLSIFFLCFSFATGEPMKALVTTIQKYTVKRVLLIGGTALFFAQIVLF
jgi:hypothetical protein